MHSSVGDVLLPSSFSTTDNRGCMTPTDAFDFKVLVMYLCNTHVKLEIHLSLPDNNVQNGACCMNHYLQPRVVLLMNMHEHRDGEERFVQLVFWSSRRWFCSMFEFELPEPHHPQLFQPS
jgi:hypothetical protein